MPCIYPSELREMLAEDLDEQPEPQSYYYGCHYCGETVIYDKPLGPEQVADCGTCDNTDL